MIEVKIIGIPRPGGSKTALPLKSKHGGYVLNAGGHLMINMVDASTHGKGWRELVAFCARKIYKSTPPMQGALTVRVEFRMPRRQNEWRKDGTLAKGARPHATMAPDATKLWRSTEDALKGIAWRDDAQVVRQLIVKRFVRWGEEPGATIRIREIGK